MLRTFLFFYENVLLHQETLHWQVILPLNRREYNEMGKLEYSRHREAQKSVHVFG